ncbi:S24 family peptidase [Pseudomonas sp. SP16.1]|uniref:S24 family peptidase n=1 Tax=Pseudomonas sp. SP16.1 TaxID=3458854 RepID=UPI0040464E3F
MLFFGREIPEPQGRHQRVALAIEHSGKTKSYIATRCGVSASAVTQWTSGETAAIRPENLFALASETGVSAKWIATGEGPPEPYTPKANVYAWKAPDDLPDDEFIIAPRLSVRFAAGSGEMVIEEIHQDQGNAYRMDWIRRRRLSPKNLADFIVRGDSMSPTLPDASKVTLDLSNTSITDGAVYGIRYGDELRIKRLFKRFDGGLIIRSDNSSKYPEESIDPEQLEQIAVIGRYVAHSFDGDI